MGFSDPSLSPASNPETTRRGKSSSPPPRGLTAGRTVPQSALEVDIKDWQGKRKEKATILTLILSEEEGKMNCTFPKKLMF